MSVLRGPGALSRLWAKWKSFNFPWRRQRLVGMDLQGNTFWVFQDKLNAGRLRRIARSNPKTHYADIRYTRLEAQWHQWLRYTRPDPPSLEELQADVQRQLQLKDLVRLADERWAAKPSYLDAPAQTSQPAPATTPRDPGGYAPQTEPDEKEGVRNAVASSIEEEQHTQQEQNLKKEDPWKQARASNPGDGYQPQSWTPGPRKR